MIILEGSLRSVKQKLIKILLICEVVFLTLCLLIGALTHMQKIKNKSTLFLDATRNDFLIDDKRSLVQKSELARISHDFLSIEFKDKGESTVKRLSWFDFSYELPIVSDAENPKSDVLGKVIYNYSLAPGLLNGLLAWILVSVTMLFIIPFLKTYLEKSLRAELEMQSLKELNQIASQVSHDIRSPLSALTMVIGTLKEVPEEKRLLIRNATQRINDIANDLLQKGKTKSIVTNESWSQLPTETVSLTTEFIPVILDILVSEKRMQFREFANLEIDVDLKHSFGAFAKINATEFKRVLSNLINNAVEAFNNHHGKVVIGVRKKENSGKGQQVEVFIKDNGKGIPKHIINKLGQMGVSHGKEGTQSGSGLGIYHARKTVEALGGQMIIESTEGHGTVIRLSFPLSEAPIWFAQKIDFTGKKYLVSLDDDISIHQIWLGRLQSLNPGDIEHIKFLSGDAFLHYVNQNIKNLKQSIFLVDYELLNQAKTGLDLIEELGIEKYTILVTSRYEEPSIQNRANRLRLLILPKSLAGFVPFEFKQPKETFDWILIDDDNLIHDTWAMAAKESGYSFKGFKSAAEFNSYRDKIDLNTNIYIDSNLGNSSKGEDLAKDLFQLGFKNLYLATGYQSEQFPEMPYIKGIVGKDAPV